MESTPKRETRAAPSNTSPSKKKLWREKQCAKCPWKVTTDPYDIPNSYCPTKHGKLKGTIAEQGSLRSTGRAMACHESKPSDKEPFCVGWLMHQLGPGNNISLRMRMLQYDLKDVELDGDQHESFEDTLPQD